MDIPSYHRSVGSLGDLNSIGLFGHLGSKVNKKGMRPNGRGVSDVLGRKLKTPLPSQKPNVVGQRSKFVTRTLLMLTSTFGRSTTECLDRVITERIWCW